jgi:repressor LexA
MKKHLKTFKSPLLPKENTSAVHNASVDSYSGENPKPLTPKETKVLDFLTEYFITNGHSPSYQEIKEFFKLASFNSVQNYLKQLAKKNYIQLFPHQKRCIEIIKTSDYFKEKLVSDSGMNRLSSNDLSFSKKAELFYDSNNRLLQNSLQNHNEVLPSPLFELPFLGRVAAGNPIERVIDNETLAIPPHLVKKPDTTFILEVEGQSMIDEGINPHDLILVQEQSSAKNGDIIVASVDNEATVKRVYFNTASKKSEAPSETPTIELRPSNKTMPSMFYPSDKVQIRGIVVGLIRKF